MAHGERVPAQVGMVRSKLGFRRRIASGAFLSGSLPTPASPAGRRSRRGAEWGRSLEMGLDPRGPCFGPVTDRGGYTPKEDPRANRKGTGSAGAGAPSAPLPPRRSLRPTPTTDRSTFAPSRSIRRAMPGHPLPRDPGNAANAARRIQPREIRDLGLGLAKGRSALQTELVSGLAESPAAGAWAGSRDRCGRRGRRRVARRGWQ